MKYSNQSSISRSIASPQRHRRIQEFGMGDVCEFMANAVEAQRQINARLLSFPRGDLKDHFADERASAGNEE